MEVSNNEILKLLEKAKKNKKKIVHITDKSALTTKDKMKMSLCKHFIRYKRDNKLKTSELAKMLGTTSSRVSEIVHYKVKKFSLDYLIDNLLILSKDSPRIREYLVLFEEVSEMPANKFRVNEIKDLTRGVRDASDSISA